MNFFKRSLSFILTISIIISLLGVIALSIEPQNFLITFNYVQTGRGNLGDVGTVFVSKADFPNLLTTFALQSVHPEIGIFFSPERSDGRDYFIFAVIRPGGKDVTPLEEEDFFFAPIRGAIRANEMVIYGNPIDGMSFPTSDSAFYAFDVFVGNIPISSLTSRQMASLSITAMGGVMPLTTANLINQYVESGRNRNLLPILSNDALNTPPVN